MRSALRRGPAAGPDRRADRAGARSDIPDGRDRAGSRRPVPRRPAGRGRAAGPGPTLGATVRQDPAAGQGPTPGRGGVQHLLERAARVRQARPQERVARSPERPPHGPAHAAGRTYGGRTARGRSRRRTASLGISRPCTDTRPDAVIAARRARRPWLGRRGSACATSVGFPGATGRRSSHSAASPGRSAWLPAG
jgi:hypothetical protein